MSTTTTACIVPACERLYCWSGSYREIWLGNSVSVSWCFDLLSTYIALLCVVQVTGGGSKSLCQNNVIECQWACCFPQRK